MAKRNGVTARINCDLADIRKEISERNKITMVEADREIAKAVRNMKGKIKSVKEIIF